MIDHETKMARQLLQGLEDCLPDVEDVSVEDCVHVLIRLGLLLSRIIALHAALTTKVLTSGKGSKDANVDRSLSMEEVAPLMGISTSWLEKHWRELPFGSKEGSRVVFSSAGLQRYLRSRQGRTS